MITIYADGASLNQIGTLPQVEGYTFNPSLMKKAGITKMKDFAKEVLARTNYPVSFEVLADDFETMERQAHEIQSWGDNVYVKIPITNTRGEPSIDLIDRLSDLNLNITAVFTQAQVDALHSVVWSHHIVSIFAGRIRDANGHIPVWQTGFKAKILWASTRQTHDMTEAEMRRFDLITMTPDLIAKLPLRGKDLTEFSRETVQQFFEDGKGIEL